MGEVDLSYSNADEEPKKGQAGDVNKAKDLRAVRGRHRRATEFEQLCFNGKERWLATEFSSIRLSKTAEVPSEGETLHIEERFQDESSREFELDSNGKLLNTNGKNTSVTALDGLLDYAKHLVRKERLARLAAILGVHNNFKLKAGNNSFEIEHNPKEYPEASYLFRFSSDKADKHFQVGRRGSLQKSALSLTEDEQSLEIGDVLTEADLDLQLSKFEKVLDCFRRVNIVSGLLGDSTSRVFRFEDGELRVAIDPIHGFVLRAQKEGHEGESLIAMNRKGELITDQFLCIKQSEQQKQLEQAKIDEILFDLYDTDAALNRKEAIEFLHEKLDELGIIPEGNRERVRIATNTDEILTLTRTSKNNNLILSVKFKVDEQVLTCHFDGNNRIVNAHITTPHAPENIIKHPLHITLLLNRATELVSLATE